MDAGPLHTFAAVLASAFVLALVFVPLERLFPARPGQKILRPGLAVDVCFFLGQYLVFAGLATWVLSGVEGALDWHVLVGLRAAGRKMPFAAQAALSVALGDVLVYWFHRACHRYEILWRFHAVHHSAEHLDWVAAHREHPLDGIASQICLNLPGILLGLPFEAMGAITVVRGMWAIFIHSNVRLPVGPLRYLLGAPEVHHHHHLRAERTAHNFANLGPWVDLLFGTYHRPEGPETFPLGITEPWPKGYLAQLIEPFRPARRDRAARRAPLDPARSC
jgi:sterol desaturase/sphingolipid hydroxylase (fatty acid hydroxylase superfamily)